MTTQIAKLGRVRVVSETTFCTDQSGTPSGFIDLPVVEGSATFVPMQDHLEPEVTQQTVHGFDNSLMVLGKKSGTLALTTYLAGTGDPQDGNSAWLTTTWAMYRVLKALMGGVFQGTAAHGAATVVVAAGSTASSINVTAGHGTTGSAGGAFACLINGKYEAREILSVSTDTIVPKVAFSAAPSNGAAVLWATTFNLIEGTSANLESLQWLCEGVEAADEYSVLGSQGTIAIDIAANGIAKMPLSLTAASWNRTSTLTLAAPTSIPGFGPVVNMDSELIVGTGASGVSLVNGSCQTRNVISHASSTWTPSVAVSPIPSPEGLNSSGMIGWKRARGRAVSGQFVTYGDDSLTTVSWLTADANRYAYSINQQIGSTADSIVLITAPTVQISAVPPRTNAGDLYGLTVSWAARNDGAIASATAGLQQSAMRIHLF